MTSKEDTKKRGKIFKYISEHEESGQKVFFGGQIYDAFSLIVNLIQKTNRNITLIDGYVDVGTWKIKYTKVFHDRFLILDRTTAYHVGASLKDAGEKYFGINLIQDADIMKDILQNLANQIIFLLKFIRILFLWLIF